MKILKYIGLILLATLPMRSFGQAFDFSLVDDSVMVMTANNQYMKADLVNTGSDTLELDIIRLENDVANGWYSGLCVDGNCQTAIVDSIRVPIPPQSTSEFRMYFAFFVQPADTAHTKILFRNVNDAGNSFDQHYYAFVHESLDIEKHADASISLYPNPFEDDLFVQLDGVESAWDLLEILDMQGRRLVQIPLASDGLMCVDGRSLVPAQYLVRLTGRDGSCVMRNVVRK